VICCNTTCGGARVGAYRSAFQRPKAQLGKQSEGLGNATVWVLPNPSGLNPHHPLKELVGILRAVRKAAG
jgi:TDG/mug DNA glycosylase family protein